MRTPVDGKVDEILPDAAIIEECVSFRRSAVRDNPLPGVLGVDQKSEEVPLDLLDLISKAEVDGHLLVSAAPFAFGQGVHAL